MVIMGGIYNIDPYKAQKWVRRWDMTRLLICFFFPSLHLEARMWCAGFWPPASRSANPDTGKGSGVVHEAGLGQRDEL